MRRTTRLGAYVASAALTISGLSVAAAPAHAAGHDPIGATEGASWLAGQLRGGLLPGQFGGSDVGLSIDAAMSLRAIGGHADEVSAIADGVQGASGVDYLEYTYSYDADEDGTPEDYAGQAANATGKALAFLQSLPDPRDTVGDIDVQERLEALTTDDGASRGRIVDFSTKDGTPDGQDYANTLGQAFAARGLDAAGSSEAAAALEFLLKQQCASGYFRFAFTADESAADQNCQEGTDAPHIDATATAVLQLLPQAGDPTVDAAVLRARTWLASVQNDDGSFGGDSGDEGPNANSTGLAGWALGDTAEGREAATWLRDHQATAYDLCGKLAADRGAIAYDAAGLSAGRADGITTASQDQWRRATAQAVPALLHLAADDTPSDPMLSGPSGYQKAGSRLSLGVSGVRSGDRLCLTGPGAGVAGTASGESWTAAVTTPAGTATRTYTVHDERGHADSAAVEVLGAKTLTVTKSKSRVRRSGKVTVTLEGLAPGERAAILFKGAVKKRGVASSRGTLTATFRVGRATGRKKVVGLGQFSDIRRGTATVRVVR